MAVSVLSFKVRDIEGNARNVPVHLPDTATVADIVTLAASMAPHLDALTSGRVEDEATLSFTVDLSGTSRKAAPVANSRVGAGVTLSFENSAGVAYSQYIPAVIDDLVSGGKAVYDTTPANALDTWISDMLNGGASADPCDLNGLDIVDFKGGNQSTRK